MASRQLRSTGNYEANPPKDIIRVKWVFPQRQNEPELVDISRSQFTSPARQLRTLFAQELLEIFSFQAASNAAIHFFKPKRAVTVYDTFEAAFTWDAIELTPIPGIKTLSGFISDTVEDKDLVDLVVSADLADLPPMGNVLTELPALQRGGPWITVMGAVITDKVIVQRLTDMMWLAESSTEEAGRVYRAARVFSALRLSLHRLKEYYEGIAENDKIPPLIDSSHPRFYPYPTHYIDRLTSEKAEFTYVKPLEQSDNCVTFLARSNIARDSLVVKFVSSYGVEVHDLLAEKGYAPRLRYYGSLDDDDEGDELLSERPDSALERGIGQPPDGLFVGPLKMVVMDFITTPPSPKTVQPSGPHRRQVEEVLRILHRAGYVFGDLRSPNVLIDIQGKVKLIDFNWTGRYNVGVQDDGDLVPEDVQRQINEFAAKANGGEDGEMAPAIEERYAHYPYNINKTIKWHADVGPMKPIRPAHDWFMVEKLWSGEL
ncbi:hypothetical protein H1R20_g4446, partial [Candolleomyces eurysporus]